MRGPSKHDVVVVGAGMAGLSCVLRLRRFAPGALVFAGGRFHRVTDPWRRPWQAVATLFSPVGSTAEKLRVVALRNRARQGSLAELRERPARATGANDPGAPARGWRLRVAPGAVLSPVPGRHLPRTRARHLEPHVRVRLAHVRRGAGRAPLREPVLVLDGEGTGPVNNLCVPSAVAPEYAPEGKSLVSASVLGLPAASEADLEREVRAQLGRWFGSQVEAWRHLRTYRIAYALPDQRPECLDPVERPARVHRWLFVCGDCRDTGSLQGALSSAQRAAEALGESLCP